MFLWLIITSYLALITSAIEKPGPRFPPTKGQVWPKPQEETKEDIFYRLDPSNFDFKVTAQKCDILEIAVQRYKTVLRNKLGVDKSVRKKSICLHQYRNIGLYRGTLKELRIELTGVCEDYPHFDMDEKYSLNVTKTATATLHSASIWGILRGLETFVQLLYLTDDYSNIRLNSTSIKDYPRYPHRGLLLDTSRHYITVTNILKTLDAMEMNKMNVFHWHIVDDQSFPYESEKFPELSMMGAYHSSLVYTKSDIKRIVEYARLRGIRVIPEFDVPGHTRSWGVAFPDILTKCYKHNQVTGLGPMDPLNKQTYKLLRDLYKEAKEWFPDKYFHLGGDEVEMSCWSSNPTLADFMNKFNLTTDNLLALFMMKVVPMIELDKSIPIVWEEVFSVRVPVPNQTLVQVWREEDRFKMLEIIEAGYRVIYSASWYLDQLKSGGNWEDFYLVDPRHILHNKTVELSVVGGEACMWGEVVDDNNVLSRVWPRASAAAERLWANYELGLLNITVARLRIEEHTCRMIRRGVPAQPPSGPGFCYVGQVHPHQVRF